MIYSRLIVKENVMSFNFDLALSKFKQAWAETPLETQQEIRDRLLKAIEFDA